MDARAASGSEAVPRKFAIWNFADWLSPGCSAVEATSTEVHTTMESDKNFAVITQSRCSASGCNTSKVNLRELFGALPHLPTEVETQRLRRFDGLADAPAHADQHDVEALLAGWRRWWRNGMSKDLVAMAGRLPLGLVDTGRRLSSYLEAARLTQTGDRR